MIKRIAFATRRPDVPPETFAAVWRNAVAGAVDAPHGIRPSRVTVCTVLPVFGGPEPKHDGIGIEWFSGTAHLRRYEDWLGTSDESEPRRQADRVADRAASPVLVAEESVLRGADWLERRWRDEAPDFKHVAMAVRADGLTPAEFSARWRDHAGRVGRPGGAGTVVIPDEVKGLAYVQNHPCPTSGEWAYDAVNEVYFDDLQSLRARIEWFRDNLAAPAAGDGLFGASWFMAVREEIVPVTS